MAATAGSLTIQNMRTGDTKTIDLYIPDATGTALSFNPAGLAASTSPSTFRIPQDANYRIIDISIGTAPTAVGAVLTVNQGVVNGGTVRWANQLQTLANRQKLSVPVNAGDFIGYTQF